MLQSTGQTNSLNLTSAVSDKCVEQQLDDTYVKDAMENLPMLADFQASLYFERSQCYYVLLVV